MNDSIANENSVSGVYCHHTADNIAYEDRSANGENTYNGHTLPEDFSYDGYAARFLTSTPVPIDNDVDNMKSLSIACLRTARGILPSTPEKE